MTDMSLSKTPMNEQPSEIRRSNFDEVALGYGEQEAAREANRCLNCKNKPCVDMCPVNVDIPAFISQIRDSDFKGAYTTIKRTNALPAVCGRVCPQEVQCECACVRGKKGESVAIGRLERFAADYHMRADAKLEEEASEDEPKKALRQVMGKKVAIIGSGPAGLTCAGDLVDLGYDVSIFEALHSPGGVLTYGIPEFRLPKKIVQREIDELLNKGVKLQCNMVIGKVLSVDDLLSEGFEAFFIGSGAGLPIFMNIPGESNNGVYSANEFLTRINLMKAYKKEAHTPIKIARRVAVIGGGNVAMDAARCAKRLGAEAVYIVYRRGEEEMPARNEEIHHAKEEGIIFMLLTAPVRVNGDENGAVTGLVCEKMELSEPDESGRRKPKPIKDSEFTLDVDSIIVAIGTSPNPLIPMTTPGLSINKRGCIIADEETGETSRGRIYAGGDSVSGAATVILAMGAGKRAAAAIHSQLCANG